MRLSPNTVVTNCPRLYKPFLLALLPQLQMIDHEAVTPALQQSAKTMFGASAFPGVRLSLDSLDFSFVFFFVSFRISVFLAATLTASWRTPALGRLPRLLQPSWLGLVPDAAPTRAPAGPRPGFPVQ